MVTQFSHKRLMGKLFILHGDHGDSHFVGILVDDIAEIAKTFLQTESTGRDPDNLLRFVRFMAFYTMYFIFLVRGFIAS